MHSSYLREFPWPRFMEFISPRAERFTILKELLEVAELNYRVLELAGNRHFILAPPLFEEKYLRRPPCILVAH